MDQLRLRKGTAGGNRRCDSVGSSRTMAAEQAMSGHRIDRLSAPDLQAPGAIPVGGTHVAAPAPAVLEVGVPDRPHLVRGVHVEVDVAGEGCVVDGHRDDNALYGKVDNVVDVQLIRAPPLLDALGAPFEVLEHGVVLDDMRQNFQCKRANCIHHLGNFQGNIGL